MEATGLSHQGSGETLLCAGSLNTTARDSSARAGLGPGPGGGLRISLGRQASRHPTAEPLPPPWGHPLNQLFSLSAVGRGECPLAGPQLSLLALHSAPPTALLSTTAPHQSYQQAHSGDSVGRREPVILGGGGQGVTPEPLRTSWTS